MRGALLTKKGAPNGVSFVKGAVVPLAPFKSATDVLRSMYTFHKILVCLSCILLSVLMAQLSLILQPFALDDCKNPTGPLTATENVCMQESIS